MLWAIMTDLIQNRKYPFTLPSCSIFFFLKMARFPIFGFNHILDHNNSKLLIHSQVKLTNRWDNSHEHSVTNVPFCTLYTMLHMKNSMCVQYSVYRIQIRHFQHHLCAGHKSVDGNMGWINGRVSQEGSVCVRVCLCVCAKHYRTTALTSLPR